MSWKTAVYGWLERERRSQAFLAREAGIDSSYLSRCLNGKLRIGTRSLRRLETAMGVPSGTLVAARTDQQKDAVAGEGA